MTFAQQMALYPEYFEKRVASLECKAFMQMDYSQNKDCFRPLQTILQRVFGLEFETYRHFPKESYISKVVFVIGSTYRYSDLYSLLLTNYEDFPKSMLFMNRTLKWRTIRTNECNLNIFQISSFSVCVYFLVLCFDQFIFCLYLCLELHIIQQFITFWTVEFIYILTNIPHDIR